jgi:4-hydroxybenzoate polyprenyltransferase
MVEFFSKYILLFKSLRLKEIFLMTGFSFIGILFTDVELWVNPIKNSIVFLFILFNVIAIYGMNSFADYENDVQSQRLKIIGNLSKRDYVTLFIVSFLLFSATGLWLNKTVFALGVSSIVLWALYYLPPVRLKSGYFTGTVAHIIGGVVQFHSGYCCYSGFNMSSLVISVYFTLLLTTGHFNHELMDYEADKTSGSKTTAVRIGVKKVRILRTLSATVGLIYLTAIYLEGYIALIEFILFFTSSAALVILSATMQEDKVKIFQKLSRTVFLLCGLLLLLAKTVEAVKLYF